MSAEDTRSNKAFVKVKREGKARGGRPKGSLKLSKRTRERFLLLLRNGAYIETACAFVGIRKQTFYDAVRTAARAQERCEKDSTLKLNAEERRLVGFLDAVAACQAEAEMRDLTAITEAIKRGDWRPAAWRLERKFPEKWGRDRESGNADSSADRVGFSYIEVCALPSISEVAELQGETPEPESMSMSKIITDERLMLNASSERETLLLKASENEHSEQTM